MNGSVKVGKLYQTVYRYFEYAILNVNFKRDSSLLVILQQEYNVGPLMLMYIAKLMTVAIYDNRTI